MKPYLITFVSIAVVGFISLLVILAHGGQLPVLLPSGSIGIAERNLMLQAVFLMLIVVIPVFILIIFIGWHYRAGNTSAKYTPNWENSRMEEFIWWSIPFEIVLVLAALTWSSTHTLDPAKALIHPEQPLVVEVVALPWKWLFIYPEEGIASLNEVALPADRPIEFRITADAPMNSFWIPALGGQMYAMTGMTTTLHLIAAQPGNYQGLSANYSGEGFAQMRFTARAMNAADFNAWVAQARQSPDSLTKETYASLRKPGDAGPVRYYGMAAMTFEEIEQFYMPMNSMTGAHQ